MKKALIFSLAILCFIACKKKPTPTSCYVCTNFGLIYAPVFTEWNQPRDTLSKDTVCNMNDGLIQIYLNQHNHLDTIKHAQVNHNDSVLLEQYSTICDIQ